MKRTGKRDFASAWKKELPILLLSGENDPVGNNGKGVKHICRQLQKLGITDVTLHLFPNARHDLLHEKKNGDADEAVKALLHWIKNHQ
jgi:alpha-beta hydrolase superfamily lysophospholipase